MLPSSPQEIELTPDLIEFAKASAFKEAKKRCHWQDYEDASQFALLQLMHRPPKYDPSRGAKLTTLVYTIVKRAVIKFAAREAKNRYRFDSFSDGDPTENYMQMDRRLRGARSKDYEALKEYVEEMIRFIDNDEHRAMCRLFIECDGNMTKVAKHMGVSEGTIRYRFKLLAPKLKAAGFDKFVWEGGT